MDNSQAKFFSKWSISTFVGLIFLSIAFLPIFLLKRNLFVEFFVMKTDWYFKFFVITVTSVVSYFVLYSFSVLELIMHSWYKKSSKTNEEIRTEKLWYSKIFSIPKYFLYWNITKQNMLHNYKVDRKIALNYFKISQMVFNFIFVLLIELIVVVAIKYSNQFYYLNILAIFFRFYIVPVFNYGCFILFYKYINFINTGKKAKMDKISSSIRNRESRIMSQKKQIKLLDKNIDVDQMTEHDLHIKLLKLKIRELDKKIDTSRLSHPELHKTLRELSKENNIIKDKRKTKIPKAK